MSHSDSRHEGNNGRSSTLPFNILQRLVLSKYFVRDAKARLQNPSDDLALSLAVVHFHDGIDNLLGAFASHLGVLLPEKAYLISSFDAISKVKPLPYKTEVLQLNALRISTKHQGLVPNPKEVLALAPVLGALCDYICEQIANKPLLAVTLVDAIEKPYLRDRMSQIEELIDRGKYKEALESMAIVMFTEFESIYADWEHGVSPLEAGLLAMPRTTPEERKQVFPEPPVDTVHRIFLEMGIEPDLYYRFHNIVPRVGYDNLRDRKVILKKDRSTWHEKNWSRENCWFCLDFLISYLVRKQKGYRGFTVVRKYSLDEVRFLCDSTAYEDVPGQLRLEIAMKAGESILGSVFDYVDGAWQGDPEDFLRLVVVDSEGTGDSRYLYVQKEDVEVTPDKKVVYYDRLANI